ncbi:metallophosphoesterase [Luteolibacter sp. SL250]|uniref:metallophosphoesterase n=1 Tax=Luteolibacter sp. SL250 TaxID=2995170 RepID=UPI0022700DEA|nr:metallophosphoesterase [Luteolibacter sp. SL250]WAC18267.1 metallophosphoesterase [Luteolibacter sp. SL250]
MSPVLVILLLIPLISMAWLFWALRRLRRLEVHPAITTVMAASVIGILCCFIWIVLARQEIAPKVPGGPYSLVLLWGLFALPLIALPSMIGWAFFKISKAITGRNKAAETSPPTDPTRRRVLGAVAVSLPVVATFGTAAISIPQRTRFRIRDITVPIKDLPADLHGLRIAHLSDTHVGKFTHGKLLHELADATNQLKADLVLMTGDLIDQSINDLPEALDMMARIDPRSGLYLIEGNHDLFQGPEKFAKGVLDRGFNLLRDENAVVTTKGHPIELLGIRWHGRNKPIDPHVDEVSNNRNPEALPILLAHHPHAFDRAAELGIPLTLAGHTHGGQLMVTPDIGPGPMLYKYWSGLYRKPGASLVVSNGAGNWFPLRSAAPAEIVHIKLIRT